MRALITGITGQDGAYLAQLLLAKGYEVAGIYRRLSTPNFWRLMSLEILDKVKLYQGNSIDALTINSIIHDFDPEEVYHLAAQSFVEASFKEPYATGKVTGLGTTTMLELIRQHGKCKFYNAATSELYGNGLTEAATEEIPFRPASPYAVAKLYGYEMTRVYREAFGLYACNGILFNHESPLRGLEFVTRKVSNAVAKIKLGLQHVLYLGNLEARRDWGYAPEYVEAMWLMMQSGKPDDFIIANNESHSVRELCEMAFGCAGLDYRNYVQTSEQHLRPLDVNYLRGNYDKAHKILGWEPKVSFSSLIGIMVAADIDRWQRQLEGEVVNWDAPNYAEGKDIGSHTSIKRR